MLEMDVNYLLHRQQMALIQAQASISGEGRAAYQKLAQSYVERVDAYRRENQQRTTDTH